MISSYCPDKLDTSFKKKSTVVPKSTNSEFSSKHKDEISKKIKWKYGNNIAKKLKGKTFINNSKKI